MRYLTINFSSFLIGIFFLVYSSASFAWKFEAALTTANNTATDPNFTSQSFRQTFDIVPIVFILPNEEGADAAAIRIQSVSTAGFVYSIVEPGNDAGPGPGNEGAHAAMTNIPYIAFEPGVHLA